MKTHIAGAIAVVLLTSGAIAQTTYTGCHNHSSVQYCYGPDGHETAVTTYSATQQVTSLPVQTSVTATSGGQTTAVTDCHPHETNVFCINGAGEEVLVSLTASPTGEIPPAYTDCHAHDADMFCVAPDGFDVLVLAEGATAGEDEHGHEHGEDEQEMDCHMHAGVEHCVPVGSSGTESLPVSCELRTRDYDVGIRIGTLFVVLATSSIGVFAPLVLSKLPTRSFTTPIFVVVKQFGTGIIISTAFIHLYTHAYLMFTNQCLGRLSYEATTSAIVMAGIFLSFLVEYVGHRIVLAKGTSSIRDTSSSPDPIEQAQKKPQAKTPLTALGHHHGPVDPTNPNSELSVVVMEAGVVFHSVLIGLTLVVATDGFYRTLLVVIVFHQFFEGLALGSRIACLPGSIWPSKFIMALVFALITPLGMAIGLGVLNTFNGNDQSTIVVIGTLDALSAGILMWVGLVDMWARDWVVEGGELVDARTSRVLIGGVSLMAGLVLMSLLGKWA